MDGEIINPSIVYSNMQKRGYEFDEELKNKYLNYSKKKNNDKNISITILNDTELRLFELFNLLNNFNKDYYLYILIIYSLDYINIKNLFRFMIIRWFKFKKGIIERKSDYNENEINKILNKNFKNNISEFNDIKNKNNILDLFIENLIYFVDNDKIFLLYVVNIIREYFCP